MLEKVFIQFLALSLYVFFMGFYFCGGFKLHILRKLIWFSIFGVISILSFKSKNEFDLALILSVGSL
jgi:hypothetical protein